MAAAVCVGASRQLVEHVRESRECDLIHRVAIDEQILLKRLEAAAVQQHHYSAPLQCNSTAGSDHLLAVGLQAATSTLQLEAP